MGEPKALSATQVRIYEAIRTFWRDKGFSPCIRDLVEAARLSSTSVAHSNLLVLRRRGLIEYEPEISRSIVLPELRRLVRVFFSDLEGGATGAD